MDAGKKWTLPVGSEVTVAARRVELIARHPIPYSGTDSLTDEERLRYAENGEPPPG